jgi:hypothetical protein
MDPDLMGDAELQTRVAAEWAVPDITKSFAWHAYALSGSTVRKQNPSELR